MATEVEISQREATSFWRRMDISGGDSAHGAASQSRDGTKASSHASSPASTNASVCHHSFAETALIDVRMDPQMSASTQPSA